MSTFACGRKALVEKNGLQILQRGPLSVCCPRDGWGEDPSDKAHGEEERPEVFSAEAQRASVGRAQLLV